ncbi:hypothetical protein [Thioflexithrix psekupsensis]|uniref:Uncharacterized protein n=1 Tax=Thioflexithrix psekupsensis TaxID=1570016 RepID=A0A251X3M5_9GAMM|nr:hypothetical protein [Thioflexithrix psekupsensis]OUD12094.1 hypothetical protein TPSD3_13265 [Thioflexithrix psekupsensis]
MTPVSTAISRAARSQFSSPEESVLHSYCADLSDWPACWEVTHDDDHYGQQILAELKPFMLSLIYNGVAEMQLQQHFANLRLLGSEMVRASHINPHLRQRAVGELIAEYVDEEGGPLCRELRSDSERDSFDSTCRLLHRYFKNTH